jgi:hypothetical protein
MEGHADVGEELTASTNEEETAAEQIARGPHAAGVDIGHGEGTAPQEGGDLVGVDLVVLGLTPVDGFHVERMAQDEGDAFLGTEVGEPVPAEDALGADNEVVAIGLDSAKESLRLAAQVAVQDNLA